MSADGCPDCPVCPAVMSMPVRLPTASAALSVPVTLLTASAALFMALFTALSLASVAFSFTFSFTASLAFLRMLPNCAWAGVAKVKASTTAVVVAMILFSFTMIV